MGSWLYYIERNSTEILFHLAVVTMFYALARAVRVPPVIALALGFVPLVLAWAFENATVRDVLGNMM